MNRSPPERRLAWIASAAMLALVARPTPLRAATFTVHDVRSSREIGEATQLYVDGTLVASFNLDDGTPQRTVTIRVPTRDDGHGSDIHSYALCGTITINVGAGREIHEVNASGLLYDPNQRRYEALGAKDFTLFYLSDPTAPDDSRMVPQHSGLCHAPVS